MKNLLTWAAVAAFLAVVVGAFAGWCMNAWAIFQHLGDPLSFLLIMRAIGISSSRLAPSWATSERGGT